MSSIGEQLRAAREARGLSLEEAEQATRIRARTLAAMEAGDFSAFASSAQARGFLRNYADYLGLDASALLSGFNSAGARPRARPKAPPPRRTPAPPKPAEPLGRTPPRGMPPVHNHWWRRIVTRDLFIGVTVTGLFGVLLTWGAMQLSQSVLNPATPTLGLQLPTATVLGAAAITDTPLPPEPTATAALPTPRPNYVGVNLVVRAEQRAWVRVLVDGSEAFSGQMPPGQTREFVGNTVVELWTGNARGTRVVFNGQDQGTLGGLGEVVVRLWTVDGAVTPTPTVTTAP